MNNEYIHNYDKPRFFSRKGFTLIELLVVISIISMLSSVVLASLNGARAKAVVSRGLTFSNHTRSALYDEGIVSLPLNEGSAHPQNEWGSNIVELTNMLGMWSSDTPTGSGSSLLFNGTNQFGTFRPFVGSPINSPVTLSPAATISVWIKVNYENNNTLRAIFSNRSCGGAGGIAGQVFFGVNNLNQGRIYLQVFAGNPVLISNSTINDGRWHNIVWTNNGNNISTLYIDGVVDKSIGQTSPGTVADRSYVGFDCLQNNTYFKGFIDDLRIYKKQLAASEIQQIYAEGVKRLKLAEN